MARKSSKPQITKRPTLQMSRAEAESRIQAQVERGKQLLELQIRSKEDLESARAEERKWSDFNAELLRRIVDTDELVGDYYPAGGLLSTGPVSLPSEVRDFRSDIRGYITRLESILGRLELIPESAEIQATEPEQVEGPELSDRVFIVHGHDEEAKQSVARCIEQLGLKAIILHEQPSQGRTIIEKFEDYADVGFAVVLLTPDDIGASQNDRDNLQPRARQNVIFELGFFIGQLGRRRVCALYKEKVEIPSDFSGVLWISLDPNGAWRFALGKEMKAAGLDVDLNRLA